MDKYSSIWWAPEKKKTQNSPLYMGYSQCSIITNLIACLMTAFPGFSHFSPRVFKCRCNCVLDETNIFSLPSCNNFYFFTIHLLWVWDHFFVICMHLSIQEFNQECCHMGLGLWDISIFNLIMLPTQSTTSLPFGLATWYNKTCSSKVECDSSALVTHTICVTEAQESHSILEMHISRFCFQN